MLTRLLSHLRRTAPVARPLTKARTRALSLEALEAREVPAIIYALNATNQLLRLDSATPGTIISTTTVTGLGANESLQGIDFRPRTGQLYGSTVPTGSVAPQIVKTYVINPTTGVATFIGATAATVPGVGDVAGGYDFNPTVDRIRYVNENEANVRLNPNNGALAGADTNVTPPTAQIIGAAYDRNTDRAGTSPIKTTLYVIDRSTGMLATLGGIDGNPSPNGGVLTPIGSLGVTLAAGFEGGFDILESPNAPSALNNNGLGVAYAALTVGTTTGLYAINLTTGAATLIGALGAGTAEIYSLAAVPDGTVVVGSGLGANGDVRLLDPTTGAVRVGPIVPFAGFKGGVRVASGDVNGDGVPDAIVTAIEAGNGHVKVFDGTTGAQLTSAIGSFFSFQGFAGSVNVAAGDVNGDGYADVIVVADGANGHTKVFSGFDGTLLGSFFAYTGFLGNVTVSAGDFDHNGFYEIVTTAAINGHTKVFNADGTAFTSTAVPNFQNSFFAFSPYLGNVSVAVGDVNGDGVPDFVLSSGAGVALNVRAVSGANGVTLSSFIVNNFGNAYTGGGSVGVADFNHDGLYDIIVTPNSGTQATVVAFDILGETLGSYPAFANFQGGASVSGIRF